MTADNEFFDDNAQTPGVAGGSVDALPNMDALFDQQVSDEDMRRIDADSLRPVGTYVTEKLTMVFETEGPLDYAGNPNPRKGRSVFRFFGPATMVVGEREAAALKATVGTKITGYFTVRISPDRYNWDDGSPDTQTKLWGMAVKAYKLAAGKATCSVREVVEYVRDYPVRLRVIQKNVKEDSTGQPRNDVVAISAVREG